MEILSKLMDELQHAPYQLPHLNFVPDWLDKRVCLVVIRHFTNDGFPFAFYIHGSPNVTKLLGGSFGMQAYCGQIFATPLVLHKEYDLVNSENISSINQFARNRVCKHGPKTEQVRWRYLFETARLAWSKMEFDPNELKELIESRSRQKKKRSKGPEEDEEMEYEAYEDRQYEPVEALRHEEEVEMSEKRRGKMKRHLPDECDEAEEAPREYKKQAVQALDGATSVLDDTDTCQKLNDIKQAGGSLEDMLEYLTARLRAEQIKKGGPSDGPFSPEQEACMNGLCESIDLLSDLAEREKNVATGLESTDHLNAVRKTLEADRDEFLEEYVLSLFNPWGLRRGQSPANSTNNFAEYQQASLERFIEVTSMDHGSALLVLKAARWDVQLALSHWLDVDSSLSRRDDEGNYNDKASDFKDLDNAKALGSASELWKVVESPVVPTSNVVAASSSKGNADADTPAALAARRARLDALISSGNETNKPSSSAGKQTDANIIMHNSLGTIASAPSTSPGTMLESKNQTTHVRAGTPTPFSSPPPNIHLPSTSAPAPPNFSNPSITPFSSPPTNSQATVDPTTNAITPAHPSISNHTAFNGATPRTETRADMLIGIIKQMRMDSARQDVKTRSEAREGGMQTIKEEESDGDGDDEMELEREMWKFWRQEDKDREDERRSISSGGGGGDVEMEDVMEL